ncbi:MAG: hypothetical protein Kow0037_07270 [Calditrichia bacterium]
MTSWFKKRQRLQYFYWKRILRISVILVNSLFILLFYLYPKFEKYSTLQRQKIDIQIFIEDIPLTNQEFRLEKREAPDATRDLPVAFSDEPELPDSLKLFVVAKRNSSGSPAAFQKHVITKAKIIYEQYPELQKTKCNGRIRLLLLVEINGKVAEIEVVENSTGSVECLEVAKRACLNSRWLPAIQAGKPIPSWVEKTYLFKEK